MKRFACWAALVLVVLVSSVVTSDADQETAVVVARVSGCDYFLADGRKGLYLLEWYGGHDPDEGDTLVGEIASYGFQDVYYISVRSRGRIYVEDYLLSRSDAVEQLLEQCE